MLIKRFTTILALLAAVVLTDMQWAVMQSITWTEMVFAKERDGTSLLTVIVDTVSGKELCTSCRVIQNQRDSEQNRTLKIISKPGVVVPITFAKYALPGPDSHSLFWTNTRAHRMDDSFPQSIDHPPQA